MKWAENVARMGDRRGVCRVLVGRPERKRSTLKTSDVDWRVILKMDLQNLGWRGMEWIELAQNRDRWQVLVNEVMNLRVP
jgi:hypothetical protein